MDVLSVFSGTTDSHSLSISLETTAIHFEAVNQRYASDGVLSATDVPWNECSGPEQSSILVHYHEQDHVVCLLSSPFGLLLWRCNQVLTVGATYFINKIVQAGIEEVSSPLTNWYWNDGGRDRMADAIRAGNLPPELEVPHGEIIAVMGTLNKLDSVCEELDTVRKFKDILFGPRPDLHFNGMTIGEFLPIANRASHYLSLRSDLGLAVQWRTSLEHSFRLFEDGIFGPINGRHIIEAMGRIREGDMLREMGAPAAEFDTWYEAAIRDVYKPVYEGLREIGLESMPARNLCASALKGRIDPACVDPTERCVQVEETLPWFRLNRLAKAYQQSSFDQHELESVQAIREISEMAGLGSSLAAPFSSALENGLIGPKADWALVEETLDDFRDKFQEQDHLLRTNLFAPNPTIINPMRSYQDGFYFPPNMSPPELRHHIIMSIWPRMVGEQFLEGLVYGRPVKHPESIGKWVWEGFKTYVGSHGGTVDERWRDQFPLLCMFTKEKLKDSPQDKVRISALIFY